MAKACKVSIEGEEFELDLVTLKVMLTEKAYSLLTKVKEQGGKVDFTLNAIRKEFING